MKVYYCNETIKTESKTRRKNSKSHLYKAKYIKEEVIYHNIILDNVEKIKKVKS